MGDNGPYPDMVAGRYVLEERLGEGGMGIVFKCLDTRSKQHYAIKFLKFQGLTSEKGLKRFDHECRILKHFRHPNIIRNFDFGVQGEFPYLITELCLDESGRPFTLGDLWQRSANRRLDADTLTHLLPQILGAVAELHKQGLIHRDIKPENILLKKGPDGKLVAKLSDFGLIAIGGDDIEERMRYSVSLSRQLDSERERALVGTYAYMSPEQKRGEALTAASDVYSLGLMFYRLSTGFERIGLQLPTEVNQGLPQWFDDMVKGAVEEDMGQRTTTAEGLLRFLPVRKKAKRGLLIAAAFAIVLVVVFITSKAMGPEQRSPQPDPDGVAKHRPPVPQPKPDEPDKDPGGSKPNGTGDPVAKDPDLPFNQGSKREDPDKDPQPVPVNQGNVQDKPAPKRVLKQGPVPKFGQTIRIKGMKLTLIPIKKGKFMMGYRKDAKEVKLDYDFWMGRCEVRQGDFRKVKHIWSRLSANELPAHFVGWEEAINFAWMINERERRYGRLPKGYVYRIPTEAEWEYCCRAGRQDPPVERGDFARYKKEAWYFSGAPKPVGTRKPNPWGLYDLHGNVSEWCYSSSPEEDLGRIGRDPMEYDLDIPVLRGSNWKTGAGDPSNRYSRIYGRAEGYATGLRLVLAPDVFGELKHLTPEKELKRQLRFKSQLNYRDRKSSFGKDIFLDIGGEFRKLDIAGIGIRDLSILKGSKVRELSLSETGIDDIKALQGLPLVKLNISRTRVRDLKPLVGMKLEELDLQRTEVVDLAPLKGMPLRKLVCSGDVNDFSPLRGMPLTHLTLSSNNVYQDKAPDLSPLASLKRLESLSLDGFGFLKDLKFLEGLHLRKLAVTNCKLEDISALRGAPVEELHLDLSWKRLVDISVLADCAKLKTLKLYGDYSDLSVLKEHPSLETINGDSKARTMKYIEARKKRAALRKQVETVRKAYPAVYARGGAIIMTRQNMVHVNVSAARSGTTNVDIAALEGLPVEQLDITGTKVRDSDLSVLKGMPLKQLRMANTDITDLKKLEGLPLEVLDVSRTGIESLEPLKGMKLKELELARTKVTDLTPLEGMALKKLVLAKTPVKDPKPLEGMSIIYLDLDGTYVKDFTSVEKIRDLGFLVLPRKPVSMESLKYRYPGLFGKYKKVTWRQ